MKITHLTLALVIGVGGSRLAAQHSAMPAGMSHEEHLRQMQKDEALKQRGGIAMGFDQDKTEHHFLLQRSGGAIVVTARDAADTASTAQIRTHFQQIAQSFGDGLFTKPVETHGELPPGAATMTARKAQIRYRYEERANGAGVVIETSDAEALAAIHDFLRYQIVEHKTGDPLSAPR